jgi:hypothetical protein
MTNSGSGPAGLGLVGIFLLGGVRRFLDEGRDPVQFLFETGNEVARPIFKQDDKAESEKHKQKNPEQSANEAHARTLTYSVPAVNAVVRNIRQSAPLMLR